VTVVRLACVLLQARSREYSLQGRPLPY